MPALAAPGEELSAGVEPPPPRAGGAEGGEEAELPGDDWDDVGVAAWETVGVADGQGLALGLLSFSLLVALGLAVAEAFELSVLVAEAVTLGDVVVVLVAVPLGPAGPSAGLLLVPPEGELPAEPAGVTVGLTRWPDVDAWAAVVDEGLDGHAVDVPLTGSAEVPLRPPAPLAWPIWVPVPAAVEGPGLLLEEAIPTAEPSSTRVSRSGGNVRTTPMANTAQAAARAGRSSPCRQPCVGGRPRPASPAPPRTAFHRRTRSARNPPDAPAFACLLAWAGPAWTRARIRSSPSGRGST